jgi:hypothetical protein
LADRGIVRVVIVNNTTKIMQRVDYAVKESFWRVEPPPYIQPNNIVEFGSGTFFFFFFEYQYIYINIYILLLTSNPIIDIYDQSISLDHLSDLS